MHPGATSIIAVEWISRNPQFASLNLRISEMSMETTTAKQVICPACGTKGRRVGIHTVRSLLKPEAIGTLEGIPASGDCCSSGEGCQSPSEDTGWRFCDSQECDVVYFAEEGDATFTKSELKVAAGVKERAGVRSVTVSGIP